MPWQEEYKKGKVFERLQVYEQILSLEGSKPTHNRDLTYFLFLISPMNVSRKIDKPPNNGTEISTDRKCPYVNTIMIASDNASEYAPL